MGLYLAGFDVVGVDIEPQPHYPFRFVRGDAANPPVDLSEFAFLWGSPPCQRFSRSTPIAARDNHPDLIDPIRAMFQASGKPWCIENVPGAPIRADVRLTGPMFGLKTFRLRWFETSFFALAPQVGPRLGPKTAEGFCTVVGGGGRNKGGVVSEWREAMGIDWLPREKLREAIPPAFSHHIARFAFMAMGLPDPGPMDPDASRRVPAITRR